MKRQNVLFAVLLSALLLPCAASAEDQIALGLGMPYGGLIGAKYSCNTEQAKFYLGAGLLGYDSEAGAAAGYSIGMDIRQADANYSIGFSYGTVKASTLYGEDEPYIGSSINYAYYFSGFDAPSWILGASFYNGQRDDPRHLFDTSTSGAFINLGYQF